MRIELLHEVDSTNEYIKKYLDGGEDVVVCAERQFGGKGTKGRAFLSEKGGVYLSVLKFYSDFSADKAFRIMAHAAVAVCHTVERFGAKPEIKWANDVLVNGRKICGILIENVLCKQNVRASIVGIGLNVCNDLSGLGGIAVSLAEVSPCVPPVEEVRSVLLENYDRESSFDEYLSYLKFLGKMVTVNEGGRIYPAIACEVLPDGRLAIEEKGNRRVLSVAEISIRL